jgi:mannan polymerase II complex MNN10 subunit
MQRKIVKIKQDKKKASYILRQVVILPKPKITPKLFTKVHTINHQLYNPKLKIGFCTVYNNDFQCVAELTVPTFKNYCEKHGYDYIEVTNCNCGRHPVWEKILLLKERLDKYDYLFWCDCDAIITNSSIKLETFVSNQDLVIAYDLFGLNAGLFLIRNSEWSRNYLKQVWNICGTAPFNKDYGGDQAAMNYLTRGEDLHVKIVSQRLFNSYKNSFYNRPYDEKVDWQPGDFILHLPGIHNSYRVAIFKDILANYLSVSSIV